MVTRIDSKKFYQYKHFNEAKKRVLNSKILRESVLDTPKETLNPKIWTDENTLNQTLEYHILDDIKKYIKNQNVIDSILFVGSNTGYQYNDSSDIDIELVVNDEDIDKIYSILPKGVELEGTTHPINYHVDSKNSFNINEPRGPIWDVLNHKWIIKSVKESAEIPFSYIINMSKIFMLGIDGMINEYETDKQELDVFEDYLQIAKETDKQELNDRISFKKEEIESDLDSLVLLADMLWNMRNKAFKTDEQSKSSHTLLISMGEGNKSIENAIYKVLEKFGYKEKLHKYVEIQQQIKGEIK